MKHPLRRLSALILGTAVAVSLAACSSDSSEDATSEAGSVSSAGYYPHTVSTRFGDVNIPSEPERIVALSLSSAEELVALGITPIAVASTPESLEKTTPWIADRLKGLTDPDLAPERKAVPEAIAGLEPDLIVGKSYNFPDQDDFNQVNDIAPTVLPDSEENNVDWDERLRSTAAAVDEIDGAETLIRAVTEEFRTAGSAVPDIGDKTYNWVAFTGEKFTFGNGASFELFGISPAESQQGTRTGVALSRENTRKLDADLLIVFARSDDAKAALGADPAFQNLPAVKSGAVAYLDTAGATAVNEPGPLSLRWILSELTPTLDKLADQ